MVSRQTPRQFHIEDFVQRRQPHTAFGLDWHRDGAALFQKRRRPVQHLKQLEPVHWFQNVIECLGQIGIHRVIRRRGEINDGRVAPQLPQLDAHVDTGQLRHDDVQHIEVKAPFRLRLFQQFLPGGNHGEPGGEAGALFHIFPEQSARQAALPRLVVTKSDFQHDRFPLSSDFFPRTCKFRTKPYQIYTLPHKPAFFH